MTRRRNSYEVDALGSFTSRNKGLTVVVNIENDHVVSCHVKKFLRVKNVEIVFYLAVDAENKIRSKSNPLKSNVA